MKDADRKHLIALMHGELDAGGEAELRRRLDADPALAGELARMESLWSDLEPPPPTDRLPSGFAGRVVSRARAEAGGIRIHTISLG